MHWTNSGLVSASLSKKKKKKHPQLQPLGHQCNSFRALEWTQNTNTIITGLLRSNRWSVCLRTTWPQTKKKKKISIFFLHKSNTVIFSNYSANNNMQKKNRFKSSPRCVILNRSNPRKAISIKLAHISINLERPGDVQTQCAWHR